MEKREIYIRKKIALENLFPYAELDDYEVIDVLCSFLLTYAFEKGRPKKAIMNYMEVRIKLLTDETYRLESE